LLALSAWIAARVVRKKVDSDDPEMTSPRTARKKVDTQDREDQKRRNADQGRARSAVAAVVGQARASSVGRKQRQQTRRGKR
jgi:hypothetical protein